MHALLSTMALVNAFYRVALVVDEWTDSPLIEIRDTESGEVVKLVEIHITCWPKRER